MPQHSYSSLFTDALKHSVPTAYEREENGTTKERRRNGKGAEGREERRSTAKRDAVQRTRLCRERERQRARAQ